jgi:hypothetical protein
MSFTACVKRVCGPLQPGRHRGMNRRSALQRLDLLEQQRKKYREKAHRF